MNWLRHAFAVDPPGPAEPTDAQRPIVERVCSEVVRRRLAVPALFFLEMSRPLNSLAAQTIYFFSPVLSAVLTGNEHQRFAEFLDRRGSVDYLCRRIEELTERQRSVETKPQAVATTSQPVDARRPDSTDEQIHRRLT